MIKIENVETYGWESAIRGMRNPMNSWEKSDSFQCPFENCYYDECPVYKEEDCDRENEYIVGINDLTLMKKLSWSGNDHGKFLRMINITMDINAPLYWWKEFDTYKVGTVTNSCSTMHKIHAKEFTLDDFSHEHLTQNAIELTLKRTIDALNEARRCYLNYDEMENGPKALIHTCGIKNKKDLWWQMIQLLPSSYNQRRTVQLNYAVLKNIYHARKNHKLDEWHLFCNMIKTLPYAKELIIGEE